MATLGIRKFTQSQVRRIQMSHEIFGNRAGSVREPMWHGLGTVFEGAVTATQAIQTVGMDYKYTLEPVVAAVKGADGKRMALRIPNKSAIVREATNDAPAEVMGIASDRYEVIQNVQFAGALDNLTSMWPVETVGALKGGRVVFFTLNAGRSSIGGDEINKYFLVTDAKTGKESVRFLYTPIRVVCQNTLSAALSASSVQGTLIHRTGVAQEFEFRTGLMAKLMTTAKEIDEAFEAMTLTMLTVKQQDLIFQSYWQMPKKNARMQFAEIDEDDEELRHLRNIGVSAGDEFERLVQRAAVVHKELSVGMHKFNEQHPEHANTLWGAYNVAIEHADWSNETEGSAYAALFGDRARRKHLVWKAATALL
jgi:phage/plasmid-like protein (TIGR03299 family)